MATKKQSAHTKSRKISSHAARKTNSPGQLRLTEENYKTIFDNSAVAITVTDEHENIVLWNKFAETLLGMNSDDIYNRSIQSLYPEEEWRSIRSKDIRQKGMQHHMETKIIRKDKEIIDVDLSVSVLKGPNGEVTGSIGMIVDITERKKAEEALRQSEELSRGMLETAGTGIYLLQNGRFIYVNRLLEEISGYTNGELIGTNAAEYVHPDDRDLARAKAIEALEGHSTLPYEFRTIRKDLETVWVSERVTSIEYGGNHAVVGALMDITERKIAEAESQAHTRQVETLFSISAAVSQTLNLNELLDTILKKVLAVMETGAGGIFLIDGQTNELVLKAHRGFSAGFAQSVTRMKVGRGFAGRVALSGKPVIIGRTLTDMRFDPVVLEKEGLQSLSSVPIMAKDNILGVMCVGSYGSRDFIEHDVRLLVTIANQIGMAIDNAQLYEKTVEISFVDELTGLYNRRYLVEQMERDFARASRQRSPLSLLMIDMDGLKTINDRFGHNEGSEFLKQLGKIIKSNTRASDVAARLGGDEFVLLAPETDIEEAHEVGERLLSETRQYQRQIEGWEVGMSISIGIASYPTHASDVEDILKKADEAMYEAKRAGKNRLCLAVPVASSEASATT